MKNFPEAWCPRKKKGDVKEKKKNSNLEQLDGEMPFSITDWVVVFDDVSHGHGLSLVKINYSYISRWFTFRGFVRPMVWYIESYIP